jgi:hypothetical protein
MFGRAPLMLSRLEEMRPTEPAATFQFSVSARHLPDRLNRLREKETAPAHWGKARGR